jgi:cell division septation protein DedD
MKVTKWSTSTGDFDVSEQQAEPISGEPGSLGAGPAVSSSTDAPVTASMPEPVNEPAAGSAEVESPRLVPEQGAVAQAPEVHVSKADAFKPDAFKADAPDAHSSEPEAAKETIKEAADAPRMPGKIMIMSSADHDWDHDEISSEKEAEPSQGLFGKRRIAALAAVVALAAMAGALGGALATAGLTHVASDDVAASGNRTIEASIARIDSDIMSLKASLEHTSKIGMSQFNKTSDRLDKVEKAQAEPAAKLAKLSETVDKLRATPAPAPVPVAAAAPKEVTGSVTPPAAAQASATPPKVEVGRLPTVEGWILRDVANGGALIEGRQGVYEVYAGDPVPGLGRVDAIRRQDGRWVVVTSKGLIVAR